jgi:hypothetical protein
VDVAGIDAARAAHETGSMDDEVHLRLAGSQPGAGKGKVRASDLRQAEDAAVERAGAVEVAGHHRHVVEHDDGHGGLLRGTVRRRDSSNARERVKPGLRDGG